MPSVRERVRKTLTFDIAGLDRLPVIEWAPWWDKTLDAWEAQGLAKELREDPVAMARWLDLDPHIRLRVMPYAEDFPQPRKRNGGVISDRFEYRRIRQYMFPREPQALNGLEDVARQQQDGEVFVWLSMDGFFWIGRELIGVQRHLCAFYDYPDLLHQINDELADWTLGTLEKLFKIVTPDFLTFAEDMSYNHGPMLSREHFDEFVGQYYQRLVPEIHKHGVVVLVDSDGLVDPMISWLVDRGIDGLLPWERQAGCDVEKVRARFPRFLMIGGFDKMALRKGGDAVEEEFQRLLPVMRQGGFVACVDHQTPPDVTLQDYRNYVGRLRHYARLCVHK